MKNKLISWAAALILVLGIGLMLLPSQSVKAQEASPPLIITEIVTKSAGSGQPYEYVEIYNTTSEAINLQDYQLQYFTSNFSTPANRWPIRDKIIQPRESLTLWLKKFDYPNVPLWDFNSNYDTLLSHDELYEIKLTTSGQGLHDSSLRQVGIADAAGNILSTALINDGAVDGITNRSIIYQASSTKAMTKIRNGEVPTPATLLTEQVAGPATPSNLTAAPSNQSITLAWDASEGAVKYKIYHSDGTSSSTDKTTLTIDGLENNRAYTFRVTAVDSEGNESPATKRVRAVPQEVVDNEAPNTPTGLKAKPGKDHVKLEWNSNTESDLFEYRVYINDTLYGSAPAGKTSMTVSKLELNREYTFKLTAVDQVGNESEASAPLVTGPTESVPIPDLLITELIPNTDNYAGYDAFEYFELYNNSPDPIDLNGYRFASHTWDKQIDGTHILKPWETVVIWTRTSAVSPISLEAFNYNYFYSYKSKYLNEENTIILGDISGLVNGGNTLTVYDPDGLEVVRADYSGGDVSLKQTIAYSYPKDNTRTMEKLAAHQKPTPGWLVESQAPARPVSDGEAPQRPNNLKATAGKGEATLSWDASTESDIYQYHIYKDGKLENSLDPSQTAFTLYTLIGNQTYTLQVSAEDTSGNVSEKSEPVQVTPQHQIITQLERWEHEKDPAYQGLWDISSDGPVIAGLAQGLVPQGLTYYMKKDWLLTVSYIDDEIRPGTITVTDRTTGDLLKSVVLYNTDGTPYTGHAGGITVSRDHGWVASENYLFSFNLSDLVNAENNGQIQFTEQIPLPVHAAYTVYDEGILWVGEFYEASSYPTNPSHHIENREGKMHYAWMIGFDLERNNDMLGKNHWSGSPDSNAVPDYVLSTTEKVQGAIVQKASRNGITLSTSYGRANDSVLYRYEYPLKEDPHSFVTVEGKEVPLWFLDGHTAKPRQSVEAIPMPEGIVEVQKELYVVFESGADKYRYTTTYPMDRMLKIDMKKLMKEDKGIQ
ncbi:lamin tail domain-containing protein [Mesobacillus subterraneus]|uniref:lamin tail domain-containing protein n=1 Tax=Mesobacillus subterraneus TaxID=285983 RepID=UPI0014746338|nr:lamin tail domain-containing protein [Mesobacillus subterraneus]